MVAVAAPAPRLAGLDAARALAVAGMALSHLVHLDGRNAVADAVGEAAYGRAMPLFMVLGGVGATFVLGRPGGAAVLARRAATLAAAGLVLQEAVADVYVVLHVYALFLLAAVALARAPSRALWALAAAATALGAVVAVAVAPGMAPYDTRDTWGAVTHPDRLVAALLVTGGYPLAPVLAFFVAGMAIGRLPLRAPGTAGRLAVAGAGVATAAYAGAAAAGNLTVADVAARRSWWHLLDAGGHSQMPLWVLGAGGVAVAVVGLSLATPGAGAALGPMGRLALTFYVAHLLALHLWWVPMALDTWAWTTATQVAVVAVGLAAWAALAAGWDALAGPGPLERLLRAAGGTRPARRRGRLPGG